MDSLPLGDGNPGKNRHLSLEQGDNETAAELASTCDSAMPRALELGYQGSRTESTLVPELSASSGFKFPKSHGWGKEKMVRDNSNELS